MKALSEFYQKLIDQGTDEQIKQEAKALLSARNHYEKSAMEASITYYRLMNEVHRRVNQRSKEIND